MCVVNLQIRGSVACDKSSVSISEINVKHRPLAALSIPNVKVVSPSSPSRVLPVVGTR